MKTKQIYFKKQDYYFFFIYSQKSRQIHDIYLNIFIFL